mmetsp:Transcript_13519/g.16787  ORF Transcript_13519/g.16787 Transcript_13519/m.16787 type:complete len:310 (-) Transcript_13519:191-1120(-)|eukprot:CAMPEP_0204831522 /NCGR_PEP_ID=MMETSP1346-20131115/10829_1 /ASSEMBLY_ACC=CAM_ASM_000771 /TAXON_ID=215587 /ORGANISM="Aplanochytrium stocchinoi, Strain GSBS06" /LENGTH=309 /DNA_ID=CAMNT_0051962615 /DNA_START=270 /DNA_END=1199 /DNA_ORIENTATION=-
MTSRQRATLIRPGAGKSNRKKPPVHFHESVEVYYLPEKFANEAWRARFEMWEDAPFHDELWDGYTQDFREEPLTHKELMKVMKEYKWRRRLPASMFALLYLKKDKRSSAADEVALFKERREKKKRMSAKGSSAVVSVKKVSDQELVEHIKNTGTEGNLDESKEVHLNEELSREKDRIRRSLQRRSKTRGQKALELEAQQTRRENGEDGDGDGDYDKNFESPGILERTMTAGSSIITQLLWGTEQHLPGDEVDDDEEFEEADELFAYDEYMDRLKRLDGLNNTNVPQSEAATRIKDMVLNAYNSLFQNEK